MIRSIANYLLIGAGLALIALLYWDQRGLSQQVVELNEALGKQNAAIEQLPIEAARQSAEATANALRAMGEARNRRPPPGAVTPQEMNQWLAELVR